MVGIPRGSPIIAIGVEADDSLIKALGKKCDKPHLHKDLKRKQLAIPRILATGYQQ